MKKLLFFTVAACFGLTANAQNKLTVNGTQEHAMIQKNVVDVNTSPTKHSSSKVAVTGVNTGDGPNAYGPAFGPRNNMWADEDLNTIAFIHRSDAATNGDNSSGSLRYDMSTDGGSTWNSNIGPVWNPTSGFARYPQMAMYNPTGNTTPTNAYLNFYAPTLDGSNGSWGGAVQGSVKLGGTTDLSTSLDSSMGANWYIVTDGFTAAGNKTYGLNFNQVTDAAGYTDSLSVLTGTWNATNKNYDYTNQYIKIVFGNDADGDPVWADARIAFAPNGMTGFISIVGYMANYSHYGVYHPIVLKTTDGGATWGSPVNVELNDLIDEVSGDSLITIYQTAVDTNFTVGGLSTAFHMGLTVDKNGNPHMAVNITPGSYDVNGTEFSILSGTNAIADIYSLDGGATWKCNLVGFPQTFRGDMGANADIPEDNRPYASRTAAGDRVFIHWFDTDVVTWGGSDNNFPDAWMIGYNVDTDAMMDTVATDITGPDIASSGSATFGCIAPTTFDLGGGSYQSHLIIQQLDQTTNAVLDPVKYIYYPAVYPVSGVGIDEELEMNAFELGQNFPNPANDFTRFTMNVVVGGDYTVEVMNMMGQVVLYKDLGKLNGGTSVIDLNTASLTSGVYFYTVKTNGASASKKMIIE